MVAVLLVKKWQKSLVLPIMIRMNEGTPGNIEGGELTHITGNLYLLRAKEKSVKIEIR